MSHALSIDSPISHYRIVSKLGEGGMGEVYLAQDTKLDRQVALKILPEQFASDRDRMSRFVREAKSVSALNHPNIITIYEIGESEGTHFIATEFIDGQTLNAYARSNPLKLKTVLEIAIQIASAVTVDPGTTTAGRSAIESCVAELCVEAAAAGGRDAAVSAS